MNPQIRIFPGIDQLTDYFFSRIATGITGKKPSEFFSVALSGGSTPKAIFTRIAEKYRHGTDWSRVLIFWGDERCVPPSDPQSNYRMTDETLLSRLDIPEAQIFRVLGENDPLKESIRYSALVNEKIRHIKGIPGFDLFMLGLGEDGHTASIFPYNIRLFHSECLFETSAHPVSKQIRITATGSLINNSAEICFLVTGTGKAEKVAQILQKKEGWEKLPASLVDPADGQLTWLLDEAAAGKVG